MFFFLNLHVNFNLLYLLYKTVPHVKKVKIEAQTRTFIFILFFKIALQLFKQFIKLRIHLNTEFHAFHVLAFFFFIFYAFLYFLVGLVHYLRDPQTFFFTKIFIKISPYSHI